MTQQKFSMFEYDFDTAEEEKYRQAFLALSKLASGQGKTAETVSKECPEYKPYKQRQPRNEKGGRLNESGKRPQEAATEGGGG